MIAPEELERLSNAATPGPWEARHVEQFNFLRSPENAELIVYLRNNVEDILQLVGIAELARLNFKMKGQWPADVP